MSTKINSLILSYYTLFYYYFITKLSSESVVDNSTTSCNKEATEYRLDSLHKKHTTSKSGTCRRILLNKRKEKTLFFCKEF
jgi:hypothetical protein